MAGVDKLLLWARWYLGFGELHLRVGTSQSAPITKVKRLGGVQSSFSQSIGLLQTASKSCKGCWAPQGAKSGGHSAVAPVGGQAAVGR
jgi:hypothetical protein